MTPPRSPASPASMARFWWPGDARCQYRAIIEPGHSTRPQRVSTSDAGRAGAPDPGRSPLPPDSAGDADAKSTGDDPTAARPRPPHLAAGHRQLRVACVGAEQAGIARHPTLNEQTPEHHPARVHAYNDLGSHLTHPLTQSATGPAPLLPSPHPPPTQPPHPSPSPPTGRGGSPEPPSTPPAAASSARQFRLDQSVVGPGVPLTDAQWARIEPLLPDRTPKRGGRWRDHREVIDAIAFKFQTGTQWVHLPERYGNWRGVYNRLRM
ncbi:transposase, partial [Streptomyces griseorubiginosus]|uniref:transposase n=1 Tax=Streptomyces griseorubiginosus TaxID=67304 RepID=UPI0036E754BF